MDSNVVSTVVEYGSLGLFIFFVLKMTATMRESSKEREDRWSSALERITQQWCQSIDGFAESNKKLAESNDNVARQVAYNTAMIIKHDAWSRGKLGNGEDSDVHELAAILMKQEEAKPK